MAPFKGRSLAPVFRQLNSNQHWQYMSIIVEPLFCRVMSLNKWLKEKVQVAFHLSKVRLLNKLER